MQKLSDFLSQRKFIEVTCCSCPHVGLVDPRPLYFRYRQRRRPDDLTTVRRDMFCSQCRGRRLRLRAVPPPRVNDPPIGETRYRFMIAARPGAPVRNSRAEAEQDAIDAGMASDHYGTLYLTVPARIDVLRPR